MTIHSVLAVDTELQKGTRRRAFCKHVHVCYHGECHWLHWHSRPTRIAQRVHVATSVAHGCVLVFVARYYCFSQPVVLAIQERMGPKMLFQQVHHIGKGVLSNTTVCWACSLCATYICCMQACISTLHFSDTTWSFILQSSCT